MVGMRLRSRNSRYFYERSFGSNRPLQIYFPCNKICLHRRPRANSVEFCPMVPPKMTNFCKNEDCPSSNELLEFQNGDLPRTRGSEIGLHLAACEFCEAEVEFYSSYPQALDEAREDAAEIPAPLFELAEALLKNRHGDPTALNSLLKEKNGLVTDRV